MRKRTKVNIGGVATGLVLVVPLFLGACGSLSSDAPRDTNFDWNLESDPPDSSSHLSRTETPFKEANAESDASTAEKPVPGWYASGAASQKVEVTPLDAPTSVSFAWPAQGRIISDFGSTESGGRNDGINIAVPLGTAIHAAAAGTVSYASDGLKNYGYLVLIRHEDGYVTAYAHAEKLLVTRGQKVVQGQVIGYAGRSGDVDEPQVHFEIRRGTTPVNPHPLLAASGQGQAS
jgi:murein DD-endopeptidase MepM/ murein hydrolase activator NlpD